MIEIWGEAVRSIEERIKPANRDQWLRPIECLGISEGRIRLRAPNRYHKEWFEDNFLPSILENLRMRAQRTFAVEFEVAEEAPMPVPSQDIASKSVGEVPAWRPTPGGLDGRYTFETFVVGARNQFGHAAARMVASSPGSKYNPLFLYGGVGLGKTHLLHAIGHEIHRQHPDWRITVVTCEQFVTHFIRSMMNQRKQPSSVSLMEEFRSCYRETPDVLLVDDIQFLANKDSSQDEFFHTFNALHLAQKQIVLTCDKLPAELPGVEERLQSRFAWGLIAEIGHPDLETRVAIIKRKAEIEKMALSDDVALAVATVVRSNVRELEGALLQLSARSSITGRSIDKEFAEEVLKDLVSATPQGFSIEAIQREVATYFDIKLHDLRGPKRLQSVARPRMIAMYLARKLTGSSFPEIGHRFGGKDHSTVISAVKKIERLIAQDANLRSVVTTIESHLRQR
ncbi:MAG: chromosomal replication initiator protein DnaA [Polyangia bacterium]|jgi:chromosomal replication initiator protein